MSDAGGLGTVGRLFDFDKYNILLCLFVTVVYQTAFGSVAWIKKFDKLTDLAGGSNFVVLAIVTLVVKGTYEPRQILATALVFVWGMRLSAFLFFRVMKIGEDARFDERRDQCCRFSVFWILQGTWVMLISLPVLFVNGAEVPSPITVLDVVMASLFFILFVIETVADQQKYFFRANPANKGKFCDVGVWAWSRHPNYLAEMGMWWSMFVLSASGFAEDKWQWIGILSPLFISTLLLFLSGMPILEKSMDTRYGDNEGYWEYKDKTAPVCLFPPAIYKSCGGGLKALCCCEWGIYNYRGEKAQLAPSGSEGSVGHLEETANLTGAPEFADPVSPPAPARAEGGAAEATVVEANITVPSVVDEDLTRLDDSKLTLADGDPAVDNVTVLRAGEAGLSSSSELAVAS